MKYMDVKPKPTTELELFELWQNYQTSLFISNSVFSKKIKVVCK